MKIALISIFFVASAVLSVSATSPPQCAGITCDPSTCEVLDCRCGSYKGYCGCCDYCRTCPNEECTALFQDTCSEGYRCVLDAAERSFDNGGTGHCRASRG